MYRVAIGGPITINSFLTEQDRNTAREHMLKTASTQMREAAKIGLQSLYADPTEVLEKYKSQFPNGFNILFAGNIGYAQDFDTIVNAAVILKEIGESKFFQRIIFPPKNSPSLVTMKEVIDAR